MTTIFTWNLETMEVAPEENGLTDVVKLLHWHLSAYDGVNSVSDYSTVRFGAADPDNFIPFEDLTEEEVLGWLEASINVTQIKAELQQKLIDLAVPPLVYKRAPWAPDISLVTP